MGGCAPILNQGKITGPENVRVSSRGPLWMGAFGVPPWRKSWNGKVSTWRAGMGYYKPSIGRAGRLRAGKRIGFDKRRSGARLGLELRLGRKLRDH